VGTAKAPPAESPQARTSGQLSRFAILVVAGEEGPLMVLRLPRLTGKERHGLEVRAAELIARFGQRPIQIAIQELGGD